MSIYSALNLGYAAKDIIKFLVNRFPEMKDKIKQAEKAGYSTDKILGYLNKVDPKKLEQLAKGSVIGSAFMQPSRDNQQNESSNPLIRGRQATARGGPTGQALQKGVSAAMKLGAGYLTAEGFANLMKGPEENNPQVQINPGASMPPNQTIQQAQQQASPAPGVPENTIGNQSPGAPPAPPIPTGEGIQTLKTMGLLEKAQGLLQAGNDPVLVAKTLIATANPELKKNYKQNEQMIVDAVADLAASSQQVQNAKNQPTQEIQGQEGPQGGPIAQAEQIRPEQAAPQQLQQPDERKQKQAKNANVVTLPGGEIGTVLERKKDHLVVDVDGKKVPVKLDEAIDVPASQDELADIYTNLIQKIPESERSSMINMAGYDPNHNELVFKPHDGAFYVYKDIPPEFAKRIQEAMFNAKTTGQNFYGAWSEGESSRGAGLSALIKELQKLYGGKGKEYTRKYETIYDIMSLPKQAVKAREKAKKDAERQRKKSQR